MKLSPLNLVLAAGAAYAAWLAYQKYMSTQPMLVASLATALPGATPQSSPVAMAGWRY